MSRSAWAGVLSSSLNSARYIAIRTPSRQSETAMLLIVRTLRRRLRKLFLRINDRFRDIARTSGRMRSLKASVTVTRRTRRANLPIPSGAIKKWESTFCTLDHTLECGSLLPPFFTWSLFRVRQSASKLAHSKEEAPRMLEKSVADCKGFSGWGAITSGSQLVQPLTHSQAVESFNSCQFVEFVASNQ